MLNYITEHLHQSDKTQQEIEASLSPIIHRRYQQNLEALAQFIPNLAHKLAGFTPSTTSIFVNKNSEINIVNYSTGRALYPLHCEQAIQQQVQYWWQNTAYLDLQTHTSLSCHKADLALVGKPFFEQIQAQQDKVDTLVVLGLGHGAFIQDIVEQHSPKFVIIYETSMQLLHASMSVCEWRAFLNFCQDKDIQLFIQTECHFEQDLQELKKHTNARHVFVFQHLYNTQYNQIMRDLRFANSDIKASTSHEQNETPFWMPSTDLNEWELLVDTPQQLSKNLAQLSKVYPELTRIFEAYSPHVWLPVKHKTRNEISLFHQFSLSLISDQPKHDAKMSANTFAKFPNREPIRMGYAGNKLSHFCFNQFYTETGALLSQLENSSSSVPESLDFFICFGIGNAYLFDELLQVCQINNLSITESESDFVYWTLLAADLAPLIDHLLDNDGRMFLSIGELDASIMSDFTRQFSIIGNHYIAKSHIYQGLALPSIDAKLDELRNSFRSIFAISDNVDHSFYGLQHFLHSLDKKVPYLVNMSPANALKLSSQPVFIVGNGPSVDRCLEQIKAHCEQAIIVSCGTALKTLYTHGVVPDYHAEIELYRANYDWITQVDAKAYLKQITLISANGIHPDNMALFKSTLLALKTGETPTLLVNHILPHHDYVSLRCSYPTVSNFAVNFFASAGFKELYLIGVDLGFADPNQHHSQHSAYYQNGKDVYKVTNNVDNLQKIAGNFQEFVYTKYEFNMARSMIEKALSETKLDCYNTANGAKIDNTIPLLPEDIFILQDAAAKTATMEVFESCFEVLPEALGTSLEEVLDTKSLSKDLATLTRQVDVNFTELQQIEAFIEAQEAILKSPQTTIYFRLLMQNTLQSYLAALVKVLSSRVDEQVLLLANQLRNGFVELLTKLTHMVMLPTPVWDNSVAFAELREQRYLCDYLVPPKTVCLYSETTLFSSLLSFASPHDALDIRPLSFASWQGDGVVYIESTDAVNELQARLTHLVKVDALIVIQDLALATPLEKLCRQHEGLSLLIYDLRDWLTLAKHQHKVQAERLDLPLLNESVNTLLARYTQRKDYSLMCMKPRYGLYACFRESNQAPTHPAQTLKVSKIIALFSDKQDTLAFRHYLAISRKAIDNGTVLDCFASRGMRMSRKLYPSEIIDYGYTSTNQHHLQEKVEEYLSRV